MTLAVSNLHVGGRIADLDLTFRAGELTAICGPNGAGKSTVLSCLAGLVPPDGGAVVLDQTELSTLPARTRARRIGYLPQSPEIAWDVTVEVLVGFGRLPWNDARGEKGRAAIDAAIRAMDLCSFRQRPVRQLSGGERARALMARVLATKPDWLLADEPLANLDLSHALSLMGRFREQAHTGSGVVLVLHDLATAMNYADRVVVLARGRCVANGPPNDALRADVIERVWNCSAKWLGEPGARALSLG